MTRYGEMSEKAFQAQVIGLAQLLGWHTMHVSHSPQVNRDRNVVTRYTTPTQGTMGRGWPDLVLVREKDKRLIFAELKSATGKVSPDQDRVLSILRSIVVDRYAFRDALGFTVLTIPSIEVHVWRPSDIDAIERILR